MFAADSATGLLMSGAAASRIRTTTDIDTVATTDIDTITEVASYAEYAILSERLRAMGLMEDHSEDAPPCRWRHQDLIIDVSSHPIFEFWPRWTVENRPSIDTPKPATGG